MMNPNVPSSAYLPAAHQPGYPSVPERGFRPSAANAALRQNRARVASLLLATVLGDRPARAAGVTEPCFSDPYDAIFADHFDNAVALYESALWRPCFAMLARLADNGHAAAARLALLMLRYNAQLYGAPFAAMPAQVARWAKQVLRADAPHEMAVGACRDELARDGAARGLSASRAPSRAPRPRPDRSPPSRSSSTSCSA